jgi:acetylornithine deacetylase
LDHPVYQLTRQFVDIPSVTGEEGRLGDFVFDLLEAEDWRCRRQEVSAGRFNVLATRGVSDILLTTHLDTVPPFEPSSEDEDFIYGRGACDAKGIAASMICAARALTAAGDEQVALLFVVGEETDSDGAVKARELEVRFSYVVDGEPTDNDLVIAHKGVVYARVLCRGRAAHSGYPERGESAVAKLVEALYDLQRHSFPSDPVLGESHLNIGTIQGGTAANLLAESAEAVLLLRTVGPGVEYVNTLRTVLAGHGELEVLRISEPQELEAVEGFPHKVVGYGTDVPALRALGRPLLLGPGSIFDAHTARERVAKSELVRAVELYQKLVRVLRGSTTAESQSR